MNSDRAMRRSQHATVAPASEDRETAKGQTDEHSAINRGSSERRKQREATNNDHEPRDEPYGKHPRCCARVWPDSSAPRISVRLLRQRADLSTAKLLPWRFGGARLLCCCLTSPDVDRCRSTWQIGRLASKMETRSASAWKPLRNARRIREAAS